MIRRALLAAALIAAAGSAAASTGIVAELSTCPEGRRGCSDNLAFMVDRAVEQAGNTALFVGILAISNGEPNPGIAAWFDGRQWAVGMPTPMSTGRHRASQVQRVSLPGGVCAMAKSANAPAGAYGVYVGWGAVNRGVQDDLDVAEVRRVMASADPETSATLAALLRDYAEANERVSKYDASGASAFTDMRRRNTFQNVRTFNCGENA